MKDAAVGSGARTRFRQIAGFFHLLLTEYRRAIAAAALHEDLRRMNAVARTREAMACSEIPRRVFAEFYSSGEPVRKAAAPRGTRHAERFKTNSVESATAA